MRLSANLATEVYSDDRRSVRRTLRLGSQAYIADDSVPVIISDLSEYGLLITGPIEIAVGDRLRVELLDNVSSEVEVRWTQDEAFGCEFVEPISRAVVSALLLRSDSRQAATWSGGDQSGAWHNHYGLMHSSTHLTVVVCTLLLAATVFFLVFQMLHIVPVILGAERLD